MSLPPPLNINPPLVNSANPWATTLEDLTALYECPSTGAVTTRTALLSGFPHDPDKHQYSFFNPDTNIPAGQVSTPGDDGTATASLNNLGYSPIPLDSYLGFIEAIAAKGNGAGVPGKGFIVSVTGSPVDVAECYVRIARTQGVVGEQVPLAMEVNLSCPNIPGVPPLAYDAVALGGYLRAVREVVKDGGGGRVPWGVKTAPFTHAGQFGGFVEALRDVVVEGVCPVSFVTATNTLGSCLVLDGEVSSKGEGGGGVNARLAGTGIGGMAGPPLHPLALGNVRTLREMLDEAPETRHIQIIGVGGVGDADGYRRMRDVGAAVVGVGTALGRKGVDVFAEIEKGLRGRW
ncbi:dihydroorotate dehydrogenase [Annulohypoxylon maeteangense]|uniref:dihydroorotate dehydrogenase n=1 Tax=Annulohypoxylon maeteangense TaxID=1927788 RepID=UPI002007D5A2|nr:dihydroorotate dehydrogenase [Annulohypoxylon maeteangense]KAI0885705.1 dihydroorotate dehydrogenase [Annulohypoxylon maeteangense]